jgi:hypothetical protein
MKKKYIPAILLGLTGLGLFLIFRRQKSDESNGGFWGGIISGGDTGGGGTSGGGYIPPSRNDNFPLKKGSFGEKVKELQRALLKYDAKALPKYGVDGDFGTETENALFKIKGVKTINSQSELDAINYSRSQFY